MDRATTLVGLINQLVQVRIELALAEKEEMSYDSYNRQQLRKQIERINENLRNELRRRTDE